MATQPRDNLDFEEQRVRILRAIEEVEKFAAESRKLTAESIKLEAERAKLNTDVRYSPWMLLAQGLIAGAALLGAGAALAKLLIG
jgi:hypothetical protein